ncbi:MAG: fumarylacetoacetate hydrolase family protein [Chloroherpetonaceae bacterium]
MKFIRFFAHETGFHTCFVFNDLVYDCTSIIGNDFAKIIQDGRINSIDFIRYLKSLSSTLLPIGTYADFLRYSSSDKMYIVIPYYPPQVWAVGVTYQRTMQLHEEDTLRLRKNEGLYAYVFTSARPEIFFKGLPHHCVGPNENISIRSDSTGTIVEAELACIYNQKGDIIAFTAANDVTAWDIELECPLFLNQAKIFTGGCSLGPAIVPSIEISNPLSLSVTCSVFRNNVPIYQGEGNTSNLKRSLNELTHYLLLNNRIQDGTLLCTGTAVGIPSHLSLQDDDMVDIFIENIGTLSNTAKKQK